MKLGIFIRVSTAQQKNSDSPETHELRAQQYAEQNEHEIVRVFKLLGVSGKDTYNHPESVAMREMIRLKQIDGVIISSLSRLARNTQQLLAYNSFFDEHKAVLISLKENISTDNSSGSKFFFSLLSSLATWELDNAKERMQASLETRRSQGKFTGGMVSVGFKIENAQVVIDEKYAPLRKLIFSLFIEHRRYSIVAKILTDKGYVTPKGKDVWSDVTIKRLLKNTDAKGILRSNFRGKPTEDNPTGIKPSSEWIYTKIPTLVSEEIWESANAIIKEQESKSKQTKPLNQRVHLFTGVLFDSNGHKLSLTTKTGKYTCVPCRLRIHKDDLEDVFKTRIKQFIISDEEQAEYSQSSNTEIQLKRDEIEFAEKDLPKIQAKMDRLITLSTEGQIPVQGFNAHYQPLFDRQTQLRENVKHLKIELENMLEAKASQKMVFDKSKNLYDNWYKLDRPEKRFIVQSVVNRIEFDGRNINFNLKQIAPLSSLELNPNAQHSSTTW